MSSAIWRQEPHLPARFNVIGDWTNSHNSAKILQRRNVINVLSIQGVKLLNHCRAKLLMRVFSMRIIPLPSKNVAHSIELFHERGRTVIVKLGISREKVVDLVRWSCRSPCALCFRLLSTPPLPNLRAFGRIVEEFTPGAKSTMTCTREIVANARTEA